MLERRWLLLTLYGISLVFAVSDAVKASRQKFKIATTSTTTEEPEGDDVEATTLSGDVNATTGHTLTGIPQIDYIWDPNLPRELNGYNLSEYPFYDSIPKEIDFKCDGLHDGFYASVPHKCQVYHHCLYGTRYDFLCANFTAFDQKTFICHFASEVDCANSKKYWHRNDALYKAASTTPPPTPSTTTARSTTTTSSPVIEAIRPTRRRRPFRRRPAYDYYEDEYYDDDFERPRGRGSYDRRDDYEYEDRKYMRRDRERDREFRERDREYRERDVTRRDPERPGRDEPSVMSPRERFHPRSNRREPNRPGRDPEDPEDDRRLEDRRPTKDDYDEELPTAPTGPSSGDSLVKPAAPLASVYARPRTPPKIRRPVPLSEQDRFAYKATSIQPSAGESRKRPSDGSLDDDYYDDDLEDIRPRRPMRPRRPYRERTFYDSPRDMRDRERDRPFRSRYRDEDEEIRPRKHQERPRDRYYERSRDRALDRGKDRLPERESRPLGRRPLDDKDDRVPPGDKDVLDEVKELRKNYKQVETTTTTTTTTTNRPETTRSPEDDKRVTHPIIQDHDFAVKENPQKIDKSGDDRGKPSRGKPEVEYDDYYDEPEYPPSPPPRTAVRIVKRPFLPSRGGNPNPRGLHSVGGKAPDTRKEIYPTSLQESNAGVDDKRVYDAYKVIQTDVQKRPDPVSMRRPGEPHDNIQVDSAGFNGVQRRPDDDESEKKPAVPWNAEEIDRGHDSFTTEANRVDVTGPSGPGKQRINEVSHRLQDIPESEYDVTLNEALTPSFNQESSLPSGFVLPLHRQLNREPIIQSSENNYKISRPYNPQGNQQKSFVPSPQFIPLARIPENNERSGSVQYYRTPEPVGNVYRQSRTSWQDYTGY